MGKKSDRRTRSLFLMVYDRTLRSSFYGVYAFPRLPFMAYNRTLWLPVFIVGATIGRPPRALGALPTNGSIVQRGFRVGATIGRPQHHLHFGILRGA